MWHGAASGDGWRFRKADVEQAPPIKRGVILQNRAICCCKCRPLSIDPAHKTVVCFQLGCRTDETCQNLLAEIVCCFCKAQSRYFTLRKFFLTPPKKGDTT